MRKINLLFCVVLLFLIVSCATSVSLNTLVPAEVDIGAGKTIGISTVVPFKSDRLRSYSKRAAEYAQTVIENALKQGVYTVKGVKTTDAIIQSAKTLGLDPTEQLLNAGIETLVQANIDFMDCYDTFNEDITVDAKGKPLVKIYAERHASLSISFVIWNLKTLTIVDTFSLSGSTMSDSEGVYMETSHGDRKVVREEDRISRPMDLYEEIIYSFKSKIKDRLVPHYETVKLSLLKDKNSRDYLKRGYELAENGDNKSAFTIFQNDWEKTGYTVSGYNAAILYYAMGNYSDAVALADEVYSKTGNEKALDLSLRLSELLKIQNDAVNQIENTGNKATSSKIVY